jgi:POT family proton-dependent oligopeptide transporter
MRQPKALYLLVLVQMWECFSFYGMRTLLVLYMVSVLRFSDAYSFGIYAVYTGLVEFGGVFGGLLADKLIGLRRAIFLGALIIASGHIVMTFASFQFMLFLGLGLIVIGSSLFSTNISALLGLFYQGKDSRRQEGFTLFYVGINIGALLASVVCGIVGEYYGWHYGFGLAAIGILSGIFILYSFQHLLEGKGEAPKILNMREKVFFPILLFLAIGGASYGIAQERIIMTLMPFVCALCVGYVFYKLFKKKTVELKSLLVLFLFLCAQMIFFAAEEQTGSVLLLFSQRFVSKSFLGVEMTSSMIMGISPLMIVLLGPFINRISSSIPWFGSGDNTYRMIFAFLFAALAFAVLAFLVGTAEANARVPVAFVIMSVVMISFSEIIIGPTVYSFCSEVAPAKEQGMVMGLIPIGFSLASSLGGYLSKSMAIEENALNPSLEVYQVGFNSIAALLTCVAIVLAVAIPLIHRYVNKKYEESVA